jgi:hypothetical protein
MALSSSVRMGDDNLMSLGDLAGFLTKANFSSKVNFDSKRLQCRNARGSLTKLDRRPIAPEARRIHSIICDPLLRVETPAINK